MDKKQGKEAKDSKKSGKKEEKDEFAFVEEELSEEDLELKKRLDLFVERLSDPIEDLRRVAINSLKNEVKSATSSMTGVPKPFKFLKQHYQKIKDAYATYSLTSPLKPDLADLISVLAITMSVPGSSEALKFALEGTRKEILGWGHEYLRTLGGEISDEYKKRMEAGQNLELKDLDFLIRDIVPYNMLHNAEPDAVDLLLEIDRLSMLIDFCTEHNYEKVCLYLLSCSAYAADAEEHDECMKTCFNILRVQRKYPEALRVALKMGDPDMVSATMKDCKDPAVLRQMAFMIAREQIPYETRDSEIMKIVRGQTMTEFFLMVAKDFQVLEPKTCEQIHKSHLEPKSRVPLGGPKIDSAKQNAALTYLSGFFHMGFGRDCLMTTIAADWYISNKEIGKLSAAASLGLVHFWDVSNGLLEMDKFLYIEDEFITAGTYIAMGLCSCGVKDEFDPLLGILLEARNSPKEIVKMGAIIGLSFAYAGTCHPLLLESLVPMLVDTSKSIEFASICALSLGIISLGSCNPDIIDALFHVLKDRDPAKLAENPLSRFISLGIGFVLLGKQEKADKIIEEAKKLPAPLSKFLITTITFCAYAATGNVLKVQELLHTCAEHLEGKDDQHQIPAVLGVAAIAMGEEIGNEMTFRMINHLLQYGDPIVRRVVPLAISLLSLSNPQISTMDLLTKLSYDNDTQTAQAAIFALGLIGAGTNNSRLADNLRQLAAYYESDNDHLFMVRIAQGILQLGKGLLTIQPAYSDKFLVSKPALAGIFTTLFACTHLAGIMFGNYHYLIYYLAMAVQPRMVLTLNEQLEPIAVPVRVGLAVDIAGQAGKPKTITGFQTHNSPVLLAHSERAELGTEEYLTLSSILENFIILRKNPDYIETKK